MLAPESKTRSGIVLRAISLGSLEILRQLANPLSTAEADLSAVDMEPRSRKSSTPSTTPPRRSPAKPPPSPCKSARQNCAASPEPWRQTEPPSRVPAQNPCRMPTPLQAQTCPPRARSLMGIHHRTSDGVERRAHPLDAAAASHAVRPRRMDQRRHPHRLAPRHRRRSAERTSPL